MNIPEQCLYPVQAAMEQWTDKRIIDDKCLENLLLFLLYGQTVFSQNGLRLHGFSSRQKGDQTILTVKVSQDGVPLVAFITGSTTIGCIERLLDLFEDDRLTWRKDKYPWI